MISDITGTNTGTNTGDETTATIKSKLGITTLSGSNTGDETKTTIQTKLFASIVDAVDDAAAATAGVAVGGIYRNGSVLMIRVV